MGHSLSALDVDDHPLCPSWSFSWHLLLAGHSRSDSGSDQYHPRIEIYFTFCSAILSHIGFLASYLLPHGHKIAAIASDIISPKCREQGQELYNHLIKFAFYFHWRGKPLNCTGIPLSISLTGPEFCIHPKLNHWKIV